MPLRAEGFVHPPVDGSRHGQAALRLGPFDDLPAERGDLSLGFRLQRREAALDGAPVRDSRKAQLLTQASIFLKQPPQLQALESAERDGDDGEEQEREPGVSPRATGLAHGRRVCVV